LARKPVTPKTDGSQSKGGAPEDKQDKESDVFMREVDDAMREDQLAVFWQKYGILSIAVITLGLASFGGWLFYLNSVEEAAGVKSEEFVSALDASTRGNVDGAINALEPLKDADQIGYSALAKVSEAGLLAGQGKKDEAVKSYGAIASDENIPQEFRDLAIVRQTLLEFDQLPPAQIIERLKPLAIPGAPWFASAGEMVAVAHLKLNQPELAGPVFAELAKDDTVPATVQDRASQMAGLLGIDTVNVESDEAAEEDAAEDE